MCVRALTLTNSDAQDKTILDSPVRVKTYLTEQGIEYDPGTDASVLRGRAKARMKRIRAEGLSSSAKRLMFQDSNALTLKNLFEIVESIKSKGVKHEVHYKIRFCFEDIQFDVIADKHGVGRNAKCSGRVRDGRCMKCKETGVIPVLAYSFKAKIHEINDEDTTTQVLCTESAGETMFGMPATMFNFQSESDRLSLIENISNVPVHAGLWINFSPPDDLLLLVYDVTKIDA